MELIPGLDGKTLPGVICNRCNQEGHTSPNCPVNLFQQKDPTTCKPCDSVNPSDNNKNEADEESDCSLLQFTQVSINMSQTGNRYKGLKNSWLLLDSCSNVDIFKNKHLLQDIFEVKDQSLNLQTNGGVMKSEKHYPE